MLAAYTYRHTYTHTCPEIQDCCVTHQLGTYTPYSRASDNQCTECQVPVWLAGTVGVNVPYGDVLFSEIYDGEEQKREKMR